MSTYMKSPEEALSSEDQDRTANVTLNSDSIQDCYKC